MKDNYVLDTSAVITFLENENGAAGYKSMVLSGYLAKRQNKDYFWFKQKACIIEAHRFLESYGNYNNRTLAEVEIQRFYHEGGWDE